MIEIIFAIIEAITVFSFGVFISFAFAGIQYNKKNVRIMIFTSILLATAVILGNLLPNQVISWLIMPLLVHIPNLLLLVLYYHKRFSTTLAAVCTTYLLCQPPKWIYSILIEVLPDITTLKLCLPPTQSRLYGDRSLSHASISIGSPLLLTR